MKEKSTLAEKDSLVIVAIISIVVVLVYIKIGVYDRLQVNKDEEIDIKRHEESYRGNNAINK